jgi:hypothetical protein
VVSDGMIARQLNHQLTQQQQQLRAMMSRVDAAATAAATATSTPITIVDAPPNGETAAATSIATPSAVTMRHSIGGNDDSKAVINNEAALTWLPPECQPQTPATFTSKSDVYMWANVLWDMLVRYACHHSSPSVSHSLFIVFTVGIVDIEVMIVLNSSQPLHQYYTLSQHQFSMVIHVYQFHYHIVNHWSMYYCYVGLLNQKIDQTLMTYFEVFDPSPHHYHLLLSLLLFMLLYRANHLISIVTLRTNTHNMPYSYYDHIVIIVQCWNFDHCLRDSLFSSFNSINPAK